MQNNFSLHASDENDGVDVIYNWTPYLRRQQDQWVTCRWLIEYKWDTVGGLAKSVQWDKVKLFCFLFSGEHFGMTDTVQAYGWKERNIK